MKIIFMGTPKFATFALESIYNAGYNIVAVYTQPPKPQNRGFKPELSEVHNLANSLCLNVITPSTLKTQQSQQEFINLQADIAIVSAYGMILPQIILNSTKYGCINIHPSLLPRWRGAAPIQRTMLEGDNKTGICIMKMDAGLDTGPIIDKEEIDLAGDEEYIDIHNKLAMIGRKLLLNCLKNIDNIILKDQSDIGVTYADKISKSEYKINWNDDVRKIDRIIRTFKPFGAYFEYNSERIKILKATMKISDHDEEYGKIIDNKLTIAAKSGYIYPILVQRQGKKPMNIEDMLRGFHIKAGTMV